MVHFYLRVTTFLFGVLLGILLAKICFYKEYDRLNVPVKKQIPSYKTWSTRQGLKREAVSWDNLRYGNSNIYQLESEILFGKIQVLCLIFTKNPKNLDGPKRTWVSSCNKLQLIEIIVKKNNYIAVKRTRENTSWVLLCQTLKNITDKYDWYLIVNDNTFVILENLRYFVAPYNSNKTYYLGHPVKFWNTVYNLGQAGYVFSKGTLKAVQSSLGETECLSTAYWGKEDFNLGMY